MHSTHKSSFIQVLRDRKHCTGSGKDEIHFSTLDRTLHRVCCLDAASWGSAPSSIGLRFCVATHSSAHGGSSLYPCASAGDHDKVGATLAKPALGTLSTYREIRARACLPLACDASPQVKGKCWPQSEGLVQAVTGSCFRALAHPPRPCHTWQAVLLWCWWGRAAPCSYLPVVLQEADL